MVKGFLAQAARPVKLKCKCATPLYLGALDLLCIFGM